MKRAGVVCVVLALVAGCASRSQIAADNPVKPVADLYNRNFVVAAPTYAANLVCGAPFLVLSFGIDAVYPGTKGDGYGRFINNVYFVPAAVCGAVVGAPFIPISHVCDEHPWDFDFKTTRSQSWACR